MAKVEVVLPQEAFKCNSVADDTLQPSLSAIVPKNVKLAKQPPKRKNRKRAFKDSQSRKNSYMSSKTLKNAPVVKKHSGKLSSKKKNKNRRKRKWKPYCKLSWTERRELEERNSRRALRIREEMSASGLPLAPYNTTQFLMEDHGTQEPDFNTFSIGTRHRDNSNSVNSSDEFYSCPEDEEEFLQRQFVQTYEDLQSERLQTMSKSDLVEEYVRLEDQVEELEKTLEEARLHKQPERTTVRPAGFNVAAELEKIRVFREEIEKLTLENDILARQNEILQMRMMEKT
ncbi:protein HEXIM1-like [Argiope bruennichi]|uniref:Protein HEXIM1 like protein n=1 Tax=Argiope bruennichi TaxID=94029 RepID=A0A8T0F631_ARGBR|nr:protein HEXIM1-like [Argiope bruennichi]KAF8785862.1 Protein HEXIM1 like protein [Argiope bruennichi]